MLSGTTGRGAGATGAGAGAGGGTAGSSARAGAASANPAAVVALAIHRRIDIHTSLGKALLPRAA
jgi:hypothetical protein